MLALYTVILNEVKNLLSDNTLSTLSLVGFEEILRYAQDDIVQQCLGIFLSTRKHSTLSTNITGIFLSTRKHSTLSNNITGIFLSTHRR